MRGDFPGGSIESQKEGVRSLAEMEGEEAKRKKKNEEVRANTEMCDFFSAQP